LVPSSSVRASYRLVNGVLAAAIAGSEPCQQSNANQQSSFRSR
jgi:hypothetical protein